MIYLPRHFFVDNHLEIEAALGRQIYAEHLYASGRRSAYFWCRAAAATHGLEKLAVCKLYLERLSQRGWGLFSFERVDERSGRATVRLTNSAFVLAQGIAGVPVERTKVCYMFAGWFAGAMDWLGHDTGAIWKTSCAETACAAEGHEHCTFEVAPV